MPSNGEKTADRDRRGRFVAGHRGGGRPVKPDWLRGRGIEALQYAYCVMQNGDEPTPIRLHAARMLAEYDLGKPRQAVEMEAELRSSGIEGMSMSEREAVLRNALETFQRSEASR